MKKGRNKMRKVSGSVGEVSKVGGFVGRAVDGGDCTYIFVLCALIFVL